MNTESLKDRFDFVNSFKEINSVKDLKHHWTFLAVPAVFMLALYLRYMPEQGMQYLQALDPYWIFRQSQHLALEGNIPAVDFMRYFPYNAPFYIFNVGDIVFPAAFYWMGPFLFFDSYLQWAQFYPALMGALGVVGTYLLGKELFDRVTGISSAFFLAVIPGVMHRSSAGFFEKEPIGTFFMVFSLYFFARAWIRKDQWSGILSGVMLGFFTISWGGSEMLWLLYPLVVGLTMWVNEDIENLVTVYTPLVIVGGGLASIINHDRFWFTGKYFVVNFGLLCFLWSRYLVEELEIFDQSQLKYYVPSVSILGLVALILSPLYSDFLANKFMGVIGAATQSGGGVIGGTVAESQAASLGQLVGQLGAVSSGRIVSIVNIPGGPIIGQFLSLISQINGTWTLAFIGVIMLGTKVSAMVLRKIGVLEQTIYERDYYKLLLIVTGIWTAIFSLLFQSSILFAVVPSLVAILGGIGILYGLEEFGQVEINFEWYYLLPVAWAISNILTAVTTSRIIFLAAFPTAFVSGYTFAKVLKRLKNFESESILYLSIGGAVLLLDAILISVLSPVAGLPIAASIVLLGNVVTYLYFPEDLSLDRALEFGDYMKIGLIGLIVILTVGVNFSAGYVSANGLGGSPNQLWMDNLDYMEEETPKGSTVLSWWDYGYWFESIGRRNAVADGGNVGYYSSQKRINFPLAEFLTSESPENHTDFLKKHSVDYIVLDQTMIGKYSAVSQIANRDNQDFNSMLQLSSSRNIEDSLSQNQSLLTVSRGSGLRAYVPIEQNGLSMGISTDRQQKPRLEIQGRGGSVRSEFGCVITDEGVTEFENVSQPANLQGLGEVCIAENPYNSLERAMFASQQGGGIQAKMVIVPKEIAESTIVRLYLMDGHGVDFVEKLPEASNGFVKMWKVNLEEE